ncbi:Capsule synthesis protein CapA [Penicillium cf. griseofulvum]|uniref:Capsule synthesis protein CapA n=1 Tax=Penicillium cf. griseofulvum TaxID=2972120 RepID=A0A9W9JR08_9EURO|nr:Capsule synthesis protein CapA [Penicillium cf. griseofulvum]KAJ5423841.1 Capsule synthesis protein CapA [Penicillium cf. griseofulvum]KAJ5430905.1 Capsule synthesis protein CapA [Penicillium cf. griseofulvum]
MSNSKAFTLTFTGDVMLGRLLDQLMPEHVSNEHDERIATTFIKAHPTLLAKGNYTPSSPWGTTLPLLQSSSLACINLETSVTTAPIPWPNKVFNYRMHPANLAPILHAGRIDYASLANNHTLDFGTEGLTETVKTLQEAKVAYAGVGETAADACKPAVLHLPRLSEPLDKDQQRYTVHVYSASDHPRVWASVPGFNLFDYTRDTRARLREMLVDGEESKPALKVFSVHWGPNYAWEPDGRITSLAHFLIDECGVDIVHGHSSHHVQGVEVYHGKLVIYGCGDFVDDYALNEEYRNDLGALWRVVVKEKSGGIELEKLEIFPTRVERFRAVLLDYKDADHVWVRRKISELTEEFGTPAREALGEKGEVVIELSGG